MTLITQRKKIVLLGMMSKMPVAGVMWQYVHYLVGLQRLGYDVYYVESHARTPTMFMEHQRDDATSKAVRFIAQLMKRFDLGDHWAFHAIHDDGRCFGYSKQRLLDLYASADLIINMHGGTSPLPEHYATGRLVYLETDPVELQIELHKKLRTTIEFLEPHCAFFTFGENYGRPDCRLPVSDQFQFMPTRQPVIPALWRRDDESHSEYFTTIGNWQQPCRKVKFQGEVFHWSKHYEFLKFIDLPEISNARFELALGSYTEADREMLEAKGWRVQRALDFSTQMDPYREYIQHSCGEFTVAKDQNIRLRSGWFSDRSATYLAAGRPVITQETGFSNILPTGAGLFGFDHIDDILAALDEIAGNYDFHCRSAAELADEYFSYDVVLKSMLDRLGVPQPSPQG